MRISEKAQQIEKLYFLMNDRNICLVRPPRMKNTKTPKNVKQLILMNVQFFLMDPFLFKTYNLFSHNTQSSLEQ